MRQRKEWIKKKVTLQKLWVSADIYDGQSTNNGNIRMTSDGGSFGDAAGGSDRLTFGTPAVEIPHRCITHIKR
jgi:hypothetical protein